LTPPDQSAVGRRHGLGRSVLPASRRASMTSATQPVRGCSKAGCRFLSWQQSWVGRLGRRR
jgi:hypothetical protein